MTTKRCARCTCTLPLTAFGSDRSRKDGKNVYCSKCANTKSKRFFYKKYDMQQIEANKHLVDARRKLEELRDLKDAEE